MYGPLSLNRVKLLIRLLYRLKVLILLVSLFGWINLLYLLR